MKQDKIKNMERIVKSHKKLIIGVLLILLLSITILISYREINMRINRPSAYFSKLIENGKIDDLSLTIYYSDPYILTMIPRSVGNLISGGGDNKIVIKGSRLREHIALLKKLSNYVMRPVEHESGVNARIYYVFKTQNDQNVLDVCMWGDNDNIFVNGEEVKENDIFYDVIMPFLPKDKAKKLDAYTKKDSGKPSSVAN